MIGLFERIRSLFKLLFLLFVSWRSGSEDRDLNESIGDCYSGAGWYVSAALAYLKAIELSDDPDDPRLHAKLGWAYGRLAMDEKSLRHYRIAYEKDKNPEIGIGLAFAEHLMGNIDEFRSLWSQLKQAESDIPPELHQHLDNLTLLHFTSIVEILVDKHNETKGV
jgi:tetratricopeptide (TPR) repeat protein